jgi:hypothetical protein
MGLPGNYYGLRSQGSRVQRSTRTGAITLDLLRHVRIGPAATDSFLNPEPSPPEQLQNLILFGAK